MVIGEFWFQVVSNQATYTNHGDELSNKYRTYKPPDTRDQVPLIHLLIASGKIESSYGENDIIIANHAVLMVGMVAYEHQPDC